MTTCQEWPRVNTGLTVFEDVIGKHLFSDRQSTFPNYNELRCNQTTIRKKWDTKKDLNWMIKQVQTRNIFYWGLLILIVMTICSAFNSMTWKWIWFHLGRKQTKQIFEENLTFIWLLFIFEDLAFLKLLMAKFGLFNSF